MADELKVLVFVGFGLKTHEKEWVTACVYAVNNSQDYRLAAEVKNQRPDIAFLRKSFGDKRTSTEIPHYYEIRSMDFSVLKDKVESQYKEYDWHWK